MRRLRGGEIAAGEHERGDLARGPADEPAFGLEVKVALAAIADGVRRRADQQQPIHVRRPPGLAHPLERRFRPFDPGRIAVEHEERRVAQQRQRLRDAAAGLEQHVAFVRNEDVRRALRLRPFLDLLGQPVDVDDHLLDARPLQAVEGIGDERLAGEFDERLRHRLGERAHAQAEPRGKDHGAPADLQAHVAAAGAGRPPRALPAADGGRTTGAPEQARGGPDWPPACATRGADGADTGACRRAATGGRRCRGSWWRAGRRARHTRPRTRRGRSGASPGAWRSSVRTAAREGGRNVDAGVLQQGGEIVGRMPEHAVLDVEQPDPLDAAALRQPDEVGRMIVAQHPDACVGVRRRKGLRPGGIERFARIAGNGLALHQRPEPVGQQRHFDRERVVVIVGDAIVRSVRQRHRGRPVALGHVGQQIDGGRHRLGHVLAVGQHPPVEPVAEVLDDEKTLLEIGGVKLGRAQARVSQAGVDGHDRPAVLGQMGDRAVAPAVADRRPVGARRHVHEDGRAAFARDKALVAPDRGIAVEMQPAGVGPFAVQQEASHRLHARQLAGPGAVPDEPGAPAGARDLQRHLEPVVRQFAGQPVGPFHQRDVGFGELVEPGLGELARIVQAVEVEVGHGNAGIVVGLDQREGRARHLEAFALRAQRLDEGAGERRLAAAEIAADRQAVAGAHEQRKLARQGRRRGLVGQNAD
jgi:hypothetical protein